MDRPGGRLADGARQARASSATSSTPPGSGGRWRSIFLLGLWDFRRWRKWVHLDLLVLLAFGISQAFFNAAEIGVSVPIVYPLLVYLLIRMLWIGFRGHGLDRTAGEGLRPSLPVWAMTVAVRRR